MEIRKKAALFAFGGGAYVGLELMYRGRSHGSMFCAGGLCFLLLGSLRKRAIPQPAKIAAGAGIITAVELATGLLVNRDYRVWDYRRLPGNFRGQICPQFMGIWLSVTALALPLYGWAEGMLDRVW